MAITAQNLVTRARILLNDLNSVRWTDAELLAWINDGRRDWSVLKPAIWGATARRTVNLASGSYQTLQTLAGVADAFSLVDVLHNTTIAGAVGAAIKSTTRKQLDAYRPDWRTETGTAVQNWVRDEGNILGFWVYPSVPSGRIDINVGVTATDLTSLSQTVVPSDVMMTTLLHYVLYRAFLKDSEIAQNAQLAANYLQLFTAAAAA